MVNIPDKSRRAELGARVEHGVETVIFASRWILAPIYLGLAGGLLILLLKFLQEFWHLAVIALKASEADVILGILSLVDLAMTASLLIIVMFAGYENFVSRIAHEGHRDWPTWMGTIDFAALKLKLLSSIVAISAIQLLKDFMSISKLPIAATPGVPSFDERRLFWSVVIHVVFVVSSLILALSDRVSGDHHGDPPPVPPAEPAVGSSSAPDAKP
ncbi:MAG TPA: TIGR00645 family protein [Hyphomicrobiaceae bacterium]|nr:TIGR00645 family protein [Hyphomicrobiaceae bacterium]